MFCTNCGKKIPNGSKFCGYCGADLSDAYVKPKGAQPQEPKPEKPPVDVKKEVKSEPGLKTEVLARPSEPEKEKVKPKEPVKKEEPKQAPVQPSQPQHQNTAPKTSQSQYQAPPVKPAPQPQYQNPNYANQQQYQAPNHQYSQPQYQQASQYQQYNQPGYQQKPAVTSNDFKLLGKCFTDPYADIVLSPIVSVIVFVAVFIINWISFFGIFSNGLAVTIVVIAGMYVMEYIDKVNTANMAEITGRIAFHLVLPATIMLVAGLCGRYFMNSVSSFATAYAYNYGSSSSFPDFGTLLFMLFFMILSINAFVMIQVHGLKKKTTGSVYTYVIIIALIIVICIAIVSVSSIKSGYDSLTSLF